MPLLVVTAVVMVLTSLPWVPRVWLDYQATALLRGIDQPEMWGTDTIADMYAAKVVLNDPSDMYTKTALAQTPLEAATWSREASAPYPPAALLALTGLYVAGEWTGLGYYGVVLLLAVLFLGASLVYFLRTRWYLFPLLYLNFGYFSERFVHVQDGSYLVMLVIVMTALWLARSGRPSGHVLMAVAAVVKLTPLYYLRHLRVMPGRAAIVFGLVLVVGLVVPWFIWDNYLYIYTFGYGLRGDWNDALGALAVSGLFAALLAYVESRREFDLEDRIGWSLVPVALFLALKLNASRHLLVVLLVPDKRGLRNVAAAVGLGLHTLAPDVVRFGSVGPIAATVLLAGLLGHLRKVGADRLRHDVRHPLATLRSVMRS